MFKITHAPIQQQTHKHTHTHSFTSTNAHAFSLTHSLAHTHQSTSTHTLTISVWDSRRQKASASKKRRLTKKRGAKNTYIRTCIQPFLCKKENFALQRANSITFQQQRSFPVSLPLKKVYVIKRVSRKTKKHWLI